MTKRKYRLLPFLIFLLLIVSIALFIYIKLNPGKMAAINSLIGGTKSPAGILQDLEKAREDSGDIGGIMIIRDYASGRMLEKIHFSLLSESCLISIDRNGDRTDWDYENEEWIENRLYDDVKIRHTDKSFKPEISGTVPVLPLWGWLEMSESHTRDVLNPVLASEPKISGKQFLWIEYAEKRGPTEEVSRSNIILIGKSDNKITERIWLENGYEVCRLRSLEQTKIGRDFWYPTRSILTRSSDGQEWELSVTLHKPAIKTGDSPHVFIDQPPLAWETYNLEVENNGRDLGNLLNLAEALCEADRLAEAEKSIETAMKRFPGSYRAVLTARKIKTRLRKDIEAGELLQKAFRLAPYNTEIQELIIADKIENNRTDEATDLILRLSKREPYLLYKYKDILFSYLSEEDRTGFLAPRLSDLIRESAIDYKTADLMINTLARFGLYDQALALADDCLRIYPRKMVNLNLAMLRVRLLKKERGNVISSCFLYLPSVTEPVLKTDLFDILLSSAAKKAEFEALAVRISAYIDQNALDIPTGIALMRALIYSADIPAAVETWNRMIVNEKDLGKMAKLVRFAVEAGLEVDIKPVTRTISIEGAKEALLPLQPVLIMTEALELNGSYNEAIIILEKALQNRWSRGWRSNSPELVTRLLDLYKYSDKENGLEEFLKEALSEYRNDIYIPIALARYYEDKKEIKKGLSVLKNTVKDFPHSYELNNALAGLYLSQGNPQAALTAVDKVLEQRKNRTAEGKVPEEDLISRLFLEKKAEIFLIQGAYNLAEEIYIQLGKDPFPIYEKQVKENQYTYQELINRYRKIIEGDGYEADAVLHLFEIYKKVGLDEAAETIIMEGINRVPDRGDLYEKLAYFCYDMNRHSCALDNFSQAYDLTGDNLLIGYISQLALDNKKYTAMGRGALEKWLARGGTLLYDIKETDRRFLYYSRRNILRYLRSLGLIESYINLCKTRLEIRPNDFESIVNMGEIFISQKEWWQAREMYERSQRIAGNDLDRQKIVMDGWIRQGLTDKGLEQGRYLYDRNKRPDWVLEKLGDLYSKKERYTEALKYYEELSKRDPDNSYYNSKLNKTKRLVK